MQRGLELEQVQLGGLIALSNLITLEDRLEPASDLGLILLQVAFERLEVLLLVANVLKLGQETEIAVARHQIDVKRTAKMGESAQGIQDAAFLQR